MALNMYSANAAPQIEEDAVRALAAMAVAGAEDENRFANPPKETQEAFVGHSFETTYMEARAFLNAMLNVVAKDSIPKRLLDFGCGWGRMLRLLRHSEKLAETEMFGCDLDKGILEFDRRTIPHVFFSKTGVFPPSIYRDGMFDLIYAYSVMSHISERTHAAWAKEFHRILSPGGYVCVTTQGPRIFTLCQELRDGTRPKTHKWHHRLAACFTSPDVLARYEAGEFMYCGHGQEDGGPIIDKGGSTLADNSDYGQAVVPRLYFERAWGDLGFRVVDWDESPPQVRVTLQK
jgi:SAM-dependent methyltransferase